MVFQPQNEAFYLYILFFFQAKRGLPPCYSDQGFREQAFI